MCAGNSVTSTVRDNTPLITPYSKEKRESKAKKKVKFASSAVREAQLQTNHLRGAQEEFWRENAVQERQG